MAYDFSHFKAQLASVEEWLGEELSGIRTGRAAPAVLDGVTIESYGSKTPLKHVASISSEDAKTLRVSPWDKSQIKAIEKGIGEANLGISVSSDADGIRVFFPDLTSERRTMLAKLAREKLEQGRVSVRSERDEVWKDIQESEKDGDISEDEKFKLKEEMQKLVDASNSKLDELTEKKEKDIEG